MLESGENMSNSGLSFIFQIIMNKENLMGRKHERFVNQCTLNFLRNDKQYFTISSKLSGFVVKIKSAKMYKKGLQDS